MCPVSKNFAWYCILPPRKTFSVSSWNKSATNKNQLYRLLKMHSVVRELVRIKTTKWKQKNDINPDTRLSLLALLKKPSVMHAIMYMTLYLALQSVSLLENLETNWCRISLLNEISVFLRGEGVKTHF